MKSMFQEGSTVQKAIEKAWNDAGRPQEFSINILETETKNFLGITTKPAIVSITYNPKKQTIEPKQVVKKFVPQKKQVEQKRQHHTYTKRDENNRQDKKDVQQKQQAKRPPQKQAPAKKEVNILWNKDLVNDVTGWLKELLGCMGEGVNIDIRIDQKILNVYLDKRVLKSGEDEKLFFISLSHLLMQFLKRKYKKKFINYYLIINTKSSSNNGNKTNKPDDHRK